MPKMTLLIFRGKLALQLFGFNSVPHTCPPSRSSTHYLQKKDEFEGRIKNDKNAMHVDDTTENLHLSTTVGSQGITPLMSLHFVKYVQRNLFFALIVLKWNIKNKM